MQRKTRPIVTSLVGLVVAVVCLSGLAAVAIMSPALHLPARHPVAQAEVKTTSTVVTPVMQYTPGGRAISSIVGDLPGTFATLSGKASARGYYSPLTPLKCAPRSELVYDGLTWFAASAGKNGALAVTLLAVGPGYATTFLSTLRRSLRACDMRVSLTQRPTEGGFTATGQQVRVRGWARGDLILLVAEDAAIGKRIRGTAAAVDTLALRHLSEVCPDLSASDGAWRNPYLPGTFTGHAKDVAYRVPPMQSQPAAQPPLRYEWVRTPPRPYPNLTIPEVAEFTTAPMLVDPTSIPELPISPVVDEPAMPTPPVEASVVQTKVRVADPVGPGCGWAFLGMQPPAVNFAELESAATAAVEEAVSELAASGAAHLASLVAYADQVTAYEQASEHWRISQEREREVSEAEAALQAATEAWSRTLASVPAPSVPAQPAMPSAAPSGVPSPAASPTASPTRPAAVTP